VKLEHLLAGLLRYGSWAASLVIGLGFLLAFVDARFRDMRLVTIGIAMFILLPTLRVFVMLVYYARHRDYRMAGTAAVVFTVLITGFVIGIRTMVRLPG
jgi:uncharacterized membrane protein